MLEIKTIYYNKYSIFPILILRLILFPIYPNSYEYKLYLIEPNS